jgi:hypothetical protein
LALASSRTGMPGRNVPITGEAVLGPDRRETAWIGVVMPCIGVALTGMDFVVSVSAVCAGCAAGTGDAGTGDAAGLAAVGAISVVVVVVV